jgi:CubicO group peptidase (beta-lactamase class C family)
MPSIARSDNLHHHRRAVAQRAGLALLAAATVSLSGCSTLPMWMVWQRQSAVTDYQHFDNAPVARAAVPRPWPQAPAALRWPRGADAAAVTQMLAETGTQALLVIRRGQLVHEQYANGFARDSIGTSFSAAKSVVSLLVGIALAEGRIASVDDPVTRYLPELLANDPRFAQITLRHLLMMRSGIAFDEGYRSPFAEAARFYLADDLAAQVARLRIAGPPDQAYGYKSGDTQLLSMVVQRATGVPLARYLQDKLWQPLGAEYDASWSLDSAQRGIARGFCCLNARAVDYARIGQLVLDGGQAQGRTLVSADWLRDSTAAQQRPGQTDAQRRNIEAAGRPQQAFYAWQWRRAPQPDARDQPGDDVYAEGLYGQYIYVARNTQTVVVRLGHHRGGLFWPGWLGELARLNP